MELGTKNSSENSYFSCFAAGSENRTTFPRVPLLLQKRGRVSLKTHYRINVLYCIMLRVFPGLFGHYSRLFESVSC